jgi:hypothetical protein
LNGDLAPGSRLFELQIAHELNTQLAMERPRSATETATPMEALEIIRRMAVRHGDDQIASVLNRLGYSTGKGKRWNKPVLPSPGATISLPAKREPYPILRELV